MYSFEIERPSTIEDAVKALRPEEAMPLAGGQTLIPTLKQRLAMPSVLVSLSGISAMRGICTDDAEMICIGGGTIHAEIRDGATGFAGLSELAANVGDPAVRNRGTIGGSLANNDPSACYPAAVLGSGATVVTDRREIAADDFFQGMFETALEDNEIITQVKFPVPSRSGYSKFEQPASRFALVGAFVAQFADGVRVAITGASESGVFRWREAEEVLAGSFDAASVKNLTVPVEGMINDLHGTPEYRAHLVAVMTARAVRGAK